MISHKKGCIINISSWLTIWFAKGYRHTASKSAIEGMTKGNGGGNYRPVFGLNCDCAWFYCYGNVFEGIKE